jgi:hypothetical protein
MDSTLPCPLQTFTGDLSAALDEIGSGAGAAATASATASATANSPPPLKNRGTGAGGANTNKNGLSFEARTSIIPLLIKNGFTLHKETGGNTYYTKKDAATSDEWYFFQKSALKKYCKKYFNATLYREPDECILYKNADTAHYTLKIVEKKNQNVAGSVDTKLYAGPGFKFEYASALGAKFTIEYAFTLSTFLMNVYNEPKKKPMRQFNKKEGIPVFHGESPTYYQELFQWLGLDYETE